MFNLFDTSEFPARWTCGQWTELHGWIHIVADSLIFGAYMAIPLLLAFFAFRRRDIPFLPIFWLFAAFIFSCGFGHLVEATLFWHPWYRFSGLIKVCTALVSWATVIALIPVIPKALNMPELAAINQRLEAEISERRQAESALKEQTEALRRTNDELERFTGNVVNREERVLELKKEVNQLLQELGRDPRYSS